MTAPAVEAPGELILPEPVGKQLEWLDSAALRKLLRVGRRGMKTRFAFIAALAGHGPGWDTSTPQHGGVLQGGDVVWLAQDYTNLTMVLWREEIVPRMGHLPWVHLNASLHDVNIPGLGSLMLRSASREAIDSVRGVGKRLKGVIIDEAAWLDLRGALLDVILPALLDNNGWLIIMSTTNAGTDGGYDDTGAPQIPSYFNMLCAEVDAGGKRSADWEQFTGTAFDNPTLDPAAIQALIAEYPPDSPKLDQEIYVKLLQTGAGVALPGLNAKTHMVPAFPVPEHWFQFAAFDWGFQHPWCVGHYASDVDGTVYKRETLLGRLDLPEAIDAKVRAGGLDPSRITVYAGPDIWQQRVRAGQFRGPTIAEALQALGWRLVPADNARVLGLNNLRRYTFVDPTKPDARPRFQWMDTPNNRLCLAQMAAMPLDPKNPEDVCKVDADHAGRGGDDTYDETRYALMSRPIAALAPNAVLREGQSLGYDYANQRPRERETGEQAMQKLLGHQSTPTAGRYRVPVRR